MILKRRVDGYHPFTRLNGSYTLLRPGSVKQERKVRQLSVKFEHQFYIQKTNLGSH